MARLSWLIQVVMLGFFGTCSWLTSNKRIAAAERGRRNEQINNCLNQSKSFVVAENFYGTINASRWNGTDENGCIIFLQKNKSRHQLLWKEWPQIEINNSCLQLYIPKKYGQRNLSITGFAGNCTGKNPGCVGCDENLYKKTVKTSICKTGNYNEGFCSTLSFNDKYIINMSEKDNCINCDNPVKGPDEIIPRETLKNISLPEEGEPFEASQAVELINNLGNILSTMNGTSAALSLGGRAEGILKKTDPEEMEEVSFAYKNDGSHINIIEEREKLGGFHRAVTLSKEALEQSLQKNSTQYYAAVFRFLNMTKDDLNSTILENEVVTVELGSAIKNLTDKIKIHFNKTEYKGTPECRSWNGSGNKPNWTDEGCETIITGGNITCQCSHLTFFAILLTPNEPISTSDLNKLTTITQAGCGLSMFFLSVMFFVHFLSRRTKATKATRLLIQLAVSMFLLNFTFLVNNFVAGLHNSVGCVIMAATMHYFMLATFSWFAVQAIHLWLQILKGGRIEIPRYILKVSAVTWALPSIAAVLLIIFEKYGEQTIHADKPEDNVAMCWITDNNIHYIVNIGYYVVVFLITFSAAVFIISWLFCLRRAKMNNKPGSQNGKKVVIILGLCCVLGLTWGFAFLAYGALRLPALYIFTILNSFQGFFLFIYYHHTTRSAGTSTSESNQKNNSSNNSTLNTIMETIENPYSDAPANKK